MSRQESPSKHSDQKPPCYRLTVLGGGSTGKTSLLKRFLNDEFTDRYRETVEDLHIRTFQINRRLIQAHIFDTAGNVQFPAMRRLSIGNAQAFLLVYDVGDLNSFRMLEGILHEIKEIRSETEIRDLPIVIAGNKCDLPIDQRAITAQMIDEFMLNETLECRCVHLETSAKTNYNVRQLFETFIKISPLFLNRSIDRSPATAPASLTTTFDFCQANTNTNGHQQQQAAAAGGSPVHQKQRAKTTQRRFSLQSISLINSSQSIPSINQGNMGASSYSIKSNKAEDGSYPTTPDQHETSPSRFRSHTNSFGNKNTTTTSVANPKIDNIGELRKSAAVGNTRRAKFFKRNKTKSHDDFDIPECMVQ